MKILEEIKKFPFRTHKDWPISEEDIEVVFAWLNEEVTLSQMSFIYKKIYHRKGMSYNRIAVVLREAYRQKKLIIKMKNKD